MMTSFRVFTAISALFLTACDPSEDQALPLEDDREDVSAAGDVQAPAGPAAMTADLYDCVGTRYMIGVLDLETYPNATCEPIDPVLPAGWTWGTLFADGHPDLPLSPSQLPDDLRKFCSYTYVAATPPAEIEYQELLAVLDTVPGLTDIGPDCMGMAAAGDLNEASVRDALQDATLANLQAPSVQPNCQGADCTKLVFIDTELGHFGVSGPRYSDHASLAAGLAAAIQGPSWNGALDFENAFPGADGESSVLDWSQGGDAGSMATLALALFKATWGWRRDLENVNQAPARAIFNVSLGFMRELSPEYETRAPVQALHAALQYASCSGALVIASAGNNTDEACPWLQQGPLAPAIYEREPAPSDGECEDMNFALGKSLAGAYPRSPANPGTYHPLVYAVGGVDGLDRPLANTRVNGQPRLVAYAADSVGVDASGLSSHAAMTGTSAAAAEVSGVASVLWSLAPEMSGPDLMALIYSEGYATGASSEFQLGDSAPVHRLSYCATMKALCEGRDPLTCPDVECASPVPAADGRLGDYAAVVAQILDDPATQVFTAGFLQDEPTVCEYIDRTELLKKNPEAPVCPHCNIIKRPTGNAEDKVVMTVESIYEGLILGASMTVIRSDNTTSQYTFDSQTVDELNRSSTDVVEVPIDEPAVASAVLHFTIDDPTVGVVNQDNTIPVIE